MMSGCGSRQMLTTLVMHKQESLQYLTVDSSTYLHWRTLARSLGISTDRDLAAFLLQHYEKTSELQLTQCVKCCGPVVQYCVPCNIYMTQPTPSPSLLPPDSATVSVCDDGILPSDTILLDLGDVVETDQFLSQDIAVKTDDKTEDPMADEAREINTMTTILLEKAGGITTVLKPDIKEPREPSKLRMLMEAFTKERFNPPAVSFSVPQTQAGGKSLLTPDVLQKIKSRAQTSRESSLVGESSTSVTVTAGEQPPSSCSAESQTAASSMKATGLITSSAQPSQKQTEHIASAQSLQNVAKSLLCAQTSQNIAEPVSSAVRSKKMVEAKSSAVLSQKAADPFSPSTALSQKATQLSPSAMVSQKAAEPSPSAQSLELSGSYPRTTAEHSAEFLTASDSNVREVSLQPASTSFQAGENTVGTAVPVVSGRLSPAQSQSCVKIESTLPVAQSVQEVGESRDEDSDYHCEPLFTAENTDDRSTDQAVDHRHKKDPAFQVAASCRRTVGSGVATRHSSRKRLSSFTYNKENTNRQSRLVPQPAANSHSDFDSQVIIIGDPGSNLGRPSRTPEKKKNQVTVYRSKRIAARMAAKAKAIGAADTSPKVSDVGRKVIKLKSEVRDGSCKITSCSLKVKDMSSKSSDVSCKVSHISDVKCKANDVSSKVSILLDSDICLKRSSSVVPYKKRKSSYNKEVKSYVCPVCSEEFKLKHDKMLHIRERHGERPYACNQCNATFTAPSLLRVHMSQHSDIKPHACSECPRTFARAYDLKLHHLTHSKEQPFVCEVCGQRLKTFRFLKNHMRIHDQGDKPFICQQCGKAFRWRSNLIDHLRIHNNDKRFACPECGVKCIQSGSLRRHLERKHNPNRPRPFICDVCGEARFDKTQFEKHMMIHTGRKPFACEICGAAFIQANALVGHRKIHTERDGKSHLCSLCGAAFKLLSSVKKHMNKVHNTDKSDLSVVAVEIIDLE